MDRSGHVEPGREAAWAVAEAVEHAVRMGRVAVLPMKQLDDADVQHAAESEGDDRWVFFYVPLHCTRILLTV